MCDVISTLFRPCQQFMSRVHVESSCRQSMSRVHVESSCWEFMSRDYVPTSLVMWCSDFTRHMMFCVTGQARMACSSQMLSANLVFAMKLQQKCPQHCATQRDSDRTWQAIASESSSQAPRANILFFIHRCSPYVLLRSHALGYHWAAIGTTVAP